MKSMVKPYLIRASILAGLALLLGLGLSVLVYKSTENVQNNAVDLVEKRIPVLISISEIIADLSEQERIIYEYYRSQESEPFVQNTARIQATIQMHSHAILTQARFAKEAKLFTDGQAKIEKLFALFHQKMQLDEDNWDDLRDILQQISDIRVGLIPTLSIIEQQTEVAVQEGHHATLAQMNRTHWVVVFYGISIVLISAVVAWYIRQYALTQAKNTRLALFSQRNPNPILSVNNVGEVVFANPACEKLLLRVGAEVEDVTLLVPSNFYDLRQQLATVEDATLTVETEFKYRILQTSIHWHREIDAYDIHIWDVTERRIAEQKVKHLAFYDQNSNLPNQFKLREDLNELIEQDKPFSLGLIAIRGFSRQVSAMGVEAASTLVAALASLISKNLDSGIVFYQTSNSKFAIMCTKRVNSLSLQKLTSHISSIIEHPVTTVFGDFFVELDFGFACYPEHGESFDGILKNAHSALAISVENEHENFCLFKQEIAEGLGQNAKLLDAMRNAVEKNELFLVFQPQLDLTSQRIKGLETLVRWRHNGEIVSPADFIPLAEQSGLIVSMGRWILEQACHFAKKLVTLGYSDIVIAVNVSPRQFSHPHFCQMVMKALEAAQLPAKNLELEITEGVFMHNEVHMVTLLEQLKSVGIHLSIDDFGTGYSSMSYLKRLPIDKLKIDQSFIRDCHNNDEDKAIVQSIVSLGKSLNLSLIAEGVEEQTHVDFLTKLGCEEIQGYWYSKPLEADAFVEFIQSDNKHLPNLMETS
ncbi:putative bifunctional diguanylate cyclase/phosphodiesterase [Thalassotalea fusca]